AFNDAVPPAHAVPLYPAGYGQSRSVAVRDLDGDAEPEVVLDLYSGGAHCCYSTDIYRYNGSGYSLGEHAWGDVGYRLADLHRDTQVVPTAWAADQYLLEHRTLVARRLRPLTRAGKLQGDFAPRHFLHKLRIFLLHHGYG